MKKLLLTGAMFIAASVSSVTQASQDPQNQNSQNIVSSQNQNIVTCESLKEQIAQKIINNGIKETDFNLEVVASAQMDYGSGKVVGSCNHGKQKIIYTRFTHSADEKKADN
ncbi:DUF1161 domain-containing protein [Xenorhabdus cabanillasii]|uniref:DUF1161 domain-containing protein n=1 Tax=Xenorhabdus cabanillasii JM26 TaxID=1427517 RepID=W1ISY1_9GAMM|nr:DUF1161 domain-containing protein [Xenorhabdus cabanillasii]PHM77945.1 membrane protein [Xenorhabdus cabanillasii JM26]CDL81597.1 conserved exported hypothetical protein [Xenorhabdus cabanillasii JM26]